MANFTPTPGLWQQITSHYSGGPKDFNGSPEFFDQASGYSFAPKWKESDFNQTFDGGTFYKIKDKGTYDAPGSVYDANGNYTQDFTVHHDAPNFIDKYGHFIPLLLPFAAAAAGIGGAGAAAAGGATTAPVLGATGALTGTELGTLGAAGGAAGSAGGLSGLLTSLGGSASSLGGRLLTTALPQIINGMGGGSGGGGGMGGGSGGFNLGDIFNVGAGIYGSQQQGEAAQKFMDWMNQNQNYVKNYGTEGTPEFNYLKNTLEAKDAASGRNSQYGTRSVDLLGQLGQAKLDATSRMALGFANPYQKALNQDANKYAGLPAAITKLLGGGGGSINLSSILNGLSSGVGSGISNNDFIDMLNNSGSMPAGVDYNPDTMPTEQDILPFLDSFNPSDWGF